MPLTSQQALNNHLARWDKSVRAYRDVRARAGAARADYEHARGAFKVRTRHTDPKMTAGQLDDLADADDEIYDLHTKYRLAEAEVSSYVARLEWMRAQGDALRSEVSTERAEAQLYASDRSTP